VAVAIVVIGLIVGSAMSILDRLIGAMSDMRLRSAAFELARQNMETLLSRDNVEDMTDYGFSDIHPEIQWETAVEPFYEPISNAMWIRAVTSAGFNDSKGQYQNVEMEHWLTSLQPNVVRQILRQQKAEEEYLDLLEGTASGQTEAIIQETTQAYLAEAGLNVDEYSRFLERQRREKLTYIGKYGFDTGYDTLLRELAEEENEFLKRLGMDFDEYNVFARGYVPTLRGRSRGTGSATPGTTPGTGPSSPSDPGSSGGVEPPPPSDNKNPPITPEDLKKMGFPPEFIEWLWQILNS
jgi:hypothetical protein